VSLLSAQGLSVSLRGRALVREVSFAVEPSMRLAVLGPNGAGKSTLVRAALGLVPSSGALTLAGVDPRTAPRREVARRAGYLGQEADGAALEGLSALEVVLLGRTPHLGAFGVPGPNDVAAATAALDAVGLVAFADRDASRLSGGERRLVLLARVLAQQAALLVLDEPTAFLDLRHHHVALEAVKAHAQAGGAALAVLHEVSQARAWATHALLLKDGAVAAFGAAAEVLTAQALAPLYGVPPEVLGLHGVPESR